MIAKSQSISYTKNALAYCERGGELLTTNLCIGNSEDISKQMQKNNALNDKCLKHTLHVKIRVAPEDKGKLNTQDWIDISKKYAYKIGFQNNPYAVYIHKEATDMEHIHIVASRIKDDNKAVSDSYTHYKNMDFCREIERKYSLRKVERVLEKVKSQEKFIGSDKRKILLKTKILQVIDLSDSLDDVVFHLKNRGIKTKIGRGIGFEDEKGAYFKGSSIDRKFSLKGIEKLLSYDNQEKRDLTLNRKFSF